MIPPRIDWGGGRKLRKQLNQNILIIIITSFFYLKAETGPTKQRLRMIFRHFYLTSRHSSPVNSGLFNNVSSRLVSAADSPPHNPHNLPKQRDMWEKHIDSQRPHPSPRCGFTHGGGGAVIIHTPCPIIIVIKEVDLYLDSFCFCPLNQFFFFQNAKMLS